jgi:hypothetical protein
MTDERRWRAASIAALVFIAGYILYNMTKFRPFWPDSFTTEGLGDFAILMDESQFVVAHGGYRATLTGRPDLYFFPYAPPAVILFYFYSYLGPGLAFWLFWATKAASVLAILWSGLVYAGAAALRARWLVAVVAVLAADYFVLYDLRQQNINLVYVAMVALALLPATPALLGGVLLGLATTFKLYSIVFLPWFLWRRRFTALAVCIATLVVLWAVLPFAFFGDAVPTLFAGWLAELRNSGTILVYQAPAPLITLRHFVAGLLGTPPFEAPVATVLAVLQAGWVAAVGAYFWLTRPASVPEPPLQTGADAAVLMMLPLPFSTILQPTHGVPTLLAFTIMIAAACDARRPMAQRATLGALVLAALVLRQAMKQWSLRGGMTFAILCLCLAGLAVVVGRRVGARSGPPEVSARPA